MRLKDTFKKLLLLKIFRIVYRVSIVWRYFSSRLYDGIKWSFQQTEYSNFYYDLTDKNKQELSQFVSSVTGISSEKASAYMNEILNDSELRDHIERHFQSDKQSKDSNFHLGRRVGWYAITRATKPALVVETGVHQGVGAITLIAALKANEAEGFPGKYLGTDIDQKAGVLVTGRFNDYGTILYGDSINSLKTIDTPIDLFINDSDHSADYEYQEYLTIAPKLSSRALILGDNSHATDSLLRFSQSNGRKFLLFREEPVDHWYPGAGIGVSLPKQD